MKNVLIVIFVTQVLIGFTQNSTSYIHNFRTDYYWDSTIYKSTWKYYIELKNDTIFESHYPISIPYYSEENLKKFYINDFAYEPYKYIKNNDTIFIEFYDYSINDIRIDPQYVLKETDTIKWLLDKSNLISKQSKNGISAGGFSVFIGETKIEINGNKFDTYKFIEEHKVFINHPFYKRIKEVFFDKKTLLPIKTIESSYDWKTGSKRKGSYVTYLYSKTEKIPNFKTKKDLIIYEDSSLVWTYNQKKEFLSNCLNKDYCQCLINNLDGKMNYHEIRIAKSENAKNALRFNNCK